MSSSDAFSAAAGALFVADVETTRAVRFEPESHAAPHVSLRVDRAPQALGEYRPTPAEDELRARLRADFERELAQAVARARAEAARHLDDVAKAIRTDLTGREERLARQCVELAFVMAERLVRDRIDRDPATIERVVRDAVEQIDRVVDLVVHVHPEDAAVLMAAPDLLAELHVTEVKSDPSQRRGGCRIESDDRAWDAGLVGQLARMHDALEKVLESAP